MSLGFFDALDLDFFFFFAEPDEALAGGGFFFLPPALPRSPPAGCWVPPPAAAAAAAAAAGGTALFTGHICGSCFAVPLLYSFDPSLAPSWLGETGFLGKPSTRRFRSILGY